jgi:hypothetical protein
MRAWIPDLLSGMTRRWNSLRTVPGNLLFFEFDDFWSGDIIRT